MAGIIGIAQTTELALVAATAKTVLQLAVPANHRIKILGWGVFFDGVNTAAEPVQVRLLRQTTAGTLSALTNAVAKVVPGAETFQTSGTMNASVEPTAGTMLDMVECHPQQGYEVKFPMGQEPQIGNDAAAIQYIGIECTAPAAVNVRAKFIFEE